MSIPNVTITVNNKDYDITRSPSLLFVCKNSCHKQNLVSSITEELKSEKYRGLLDVSLLSAEPAEYEAYDSMYLDFYILGEALDEMEWRYDVLIENLAKNYIDYNENHKDDPLKLKLIIIDGIDKVIENQTYSLFLENFYILTQKSKHAGIKILAFVDNSGCVNNEILINLSKIEVED